MTSSSTEVQDKVSEPVNGADILQLENDEVAELRAEVARLNTEVVNTHTAHQKDIEIIGARLLEEAESRDWCEDYDYIIGELNGGLTEKLAQRERNFSIDVRVSYSMSFSVRATSEEEAEEFIRAAQLMQTWRPGTPFLDSSRVGMNGVYGHSVSIDIE